MKANELMIGDWVLTQRSIDGNPCQDVCMQVTVQTLDDLERGVDKVTPIPLTTEILEKNDWIFDKKYYSDVIYKSVFIYETDWYPWKQYLYVHIDETNNEITLCTHQGYEGHGDLRCCKFVSVKYVHELQHALHLCGLNDLAINFKI